MCIALALFLMMIFVRNAFPRHIDQKVATSHDSSFLHNLTPKYFTRGSFWLLAFYVWCMKWIKNWAEFDSWALNIAAFLAVKNC